MITLYGIKNCDTCKKARAWLQKQGIDFHYHDHRVDGLDPKQLADWADVLGWENLLNKSSTSWRNLDPTLRQTINKTSALKAMLEYPTLIKRPLIDLEGRLAVGFSLQKYADLFSPCGV